MQLDYVVIVVATLLQFVFGAIWYTPIFGKVWGQIHGFDKLSKAVQQEMMKKMGPPLLAQLVVTVVTTVVLAMLLEGTEGTWSAYEFAALVWIGFIVPTQVGAVLFGGTEPRWVLPKLAIMAGAGLGNTMIAAAVLSNM